MSDTLKILVATISVLCANLCFAQRKHSVPKEIQEAFAERVDSSTNQLIRYRESVIHPEISDSAILVIFLHSAGGRGSDNLSHLGMPAVKAIYDYLDKNNLHAYFIAPQCPETASWNGVAPGGRGLGFDGSSPHRPLFGETKEKLEDKTHYVQYIMPFIKNYVTEHPVSKSRIYILGTSMGAAGVWETVADNPYFFAGAFPASGTYSDKNLTSLKYTPIICTTGTEENTYNKNKSIIEKLSKAGADATFIPLTGLRHIDACNRAFTDSNLNLLFSKHR